MSTLVDGSNIKTLVEDKQAFAKYVDGKFKELQQRRSHTGKLSPQELQPIVAGIGSAMGLPSKGSSRETDHIYDEILAEFVRGEKEGITEEKFGSVLASMLLGVADGLQREPIALSKLDGGQLEVYSQSPSLELDAVVVFSNSGTRTEGRVKGDFIIRALSRLSVEQGMPPTSDPHVIKSIVEPALKGSGIDLMREFTQTEFVDAYRKVLLEIASRMKRQPVSVAHAEKTFDGKGVSELLQNKAILDQALEEAWKCIPKDDGNSIPKKFVRVGLDLVAPFAGLPPLGAVEEMDHVVEASLKLVDADKPGASIDKEGFCKCMVEMLGGMMLQLEGKPISVRSSGVAKEMGHVGVL